MTGGNDERLPAVQGKERQAVLTTRLLPDIERGIVALRLEGLVIKVFNRLVIEQAVDRAGVALGVGGVDLADVLGAPARSAKRKAAVQQQRHHDHRSVLNAVIDKEQDRHHRDFKERRRNIENKEPQQKADTVGAALDIPRQSAGTPV